MGYYARFFGRLEESLSDAPIWFLALLPPMMLWFTFFAGRFFVPFPAPHEIHHAMTWLLFGNGLERAYICFVLALAALLLGEIHIARKLVWICLQKLRQRFFGR